MAPGPTTKLSQISHRLDARKGDAAKTARPRAAKAVRAANAADDATFTLTLLIHHPDMDPQRITDELSLEPLRSVRKGADRVAPSGKPIGRAWPNTRWNHVIFYPAKKVAADSIREILRRLENHAEFLAGITRTGGRISLFVNLPGASHRGESIDSATLHRFGGLGIDFGFEVFPDWDGEPLAGDILGK